MVDFKYHVVSIVAVFLALAIGIVLGTNVLSGDVLKNLKAQTSQLRKEAQDLRAQNQQQQAQIGADQAFLGALGPTAVGGRLAGQRVVLVALPDAQKSARDQVAKTLTSAGAVVTGEVDLTSSYVDPQQAPALDQLVKSLAQPAIDLGSDGDVGSRAGAVLAAALVAPAGGVSPAGGLGDRAGLGVGSPAAALSAVPTPQAKPTPTTSPSATGKAHPKASTSATPAANATASPSTTPSGTPGPQIDPASTAVLAGLAKGGFVKLDQSPSAYATLAVVIAPPPPAKTSSGQGAADKALLALVSALQDSGAEAVLTGPTGSAEPGGLVAELRGDNSMAKAISSVDDVDTVGGRIAVVFALAAQVHGQVGQYGTGTGAQAPLPTPSPS